MILDLGKLRDQLAIDEGLRLKPYRDSVGKLTVGVGHNIDDRGISRRAAMLILEDDIEEHLALLDKYLPWWHQLDEPRQRALANMAFNLGVGPSTEQPLGKLLGFHDTLAKIKDGDYTGAAGNMAASAWAKQVGPRAARLIEVMKNG